MAAGLPKFIRLRDVIPILCTSEGLSEQIGCVLVAPGDYAGILLEDVKEDYTECLLTMHRVFEATVETSSEAIQKALTKFSTSKVLTDRKAQESKGCESVLWMHRGCSALNSFDDDTGSPRCMYKCIDCSAYYCNACGICEDEWAPVCRSCGCTRTWQRNDTDE